MNDLDALARLIDALRPWLGDLVVVGGWAHRLHRLHPLAHSPSYEALRTNDVDLAFGLGATLDGDIGSTLKAAGFHEELSGDHEPPVSQYTLGTENRGFYAEFLAPLSGSGIKRSGAPDATLSKAGITAQKVRHLDLLLLHPWRMHVGPDVGVPLVPDATVQMPNPVTFIAQKLLIQPQRDPAKQAQDVLYIHDTLELFGRAKDALTAEWTERIRPQLNAATVRRVEQIQHERFDRVTDVVRSATRIPQDRRLTPEGVRRLCAYGLGEIFGA